MYYGELVILLQDREYSVEHFDRINGWLERGDGAAIYENHDLGHPEVGALQIVSYGSSAAQLETDVPPQRLPDIGNRINWRFWLIDTVRPTTREWDLLESTRRASRSKFKVPVQDG